MPQRQRKQYSTISIIEQIEVAKALDRTTSTYQHQKQLSHLKSAKFRAIHIATNTKESLK